MNAKFYTVGILVLVFPAVLRAGEVSENTSPSPFSALLTQFEDVKTNIESNGTIRLTGHLAEQLNAQVLLATEQSRAESANEEKAAAALINPTRGPAILSADGIVSGEVSPVDYPSFGIPSETTKLDNELSLKPTALGVSGVGNLGSVANAIKKFDDESAGRLPIPYNVASTGSVASSKGKKPADPDKAGSPYEDVNPGTTFGVNPSDDSSVANLMKSKKDSNAAIDALAKEQSELDALKDKDKDKEEKEKKAAELKDKMSKVKDMKSPFTIDDYLNVRDLFNKGADQLSGMLDGDPAFQKKAAEIFGFVPQGASKSLGALDSDRNKKKPFEDFVAQFNEDKSSRFPATPPEVPNRIRVERAH